LTWVLWMLMPDIETVPGRYRPGQIPPPGYHVLSDTTGPTSSGQKSLLASAQLISLGSSPSFQ
jgi:hypothetical protein